MFGQRSTSRRCRRQQIDFLLFIKRQKKRRGASENQENPFEMEKNRFSIISSQRETQKSGFRWQRHLICSGVLTRRG